MITEKVGDLLGANDVDIIVHQANLFHTFGAGIAKAISLRFPEAFEADKKTLHGDFNKLGTYSVAKITTVNGTKPTSIKFVVNLYSQSGMGGKDRQTTYDAMVDGLTKLRNKLEAHQDTMTVGIPFQLGCGLANGDWTIVRAIIESIFGQSRIPVVIYKLPELVNVHGENESYDYMHKLRAIIHTTSKYQDSPADGRQQSSLAELKKTLNQPPQLDAKEECGLSRCEQCDGRICHSCGAKII